MILLTPGPTPVLENVRITLGSKTIHHRTDEFKRVLLKTKSNLKKIFNTEDVIVLTSSGTGAMEACVLNFCKNRALILNGGKFGDRFIQICKAHKKKYTEIKYSWGSKVNIKDIAKKIKQEKDIDTIFMQACESSSGTQNPIEHIAKEIKNIDNNIFIIVDGITVVGGEKINTTNIDVLIGSSQKAFSAPSGISMIGINKNAIDRLKTSSSGYYFNLSKEFLKQQNGETSFTPAVPLILALNCSLENILKFGVEAFYKKAYVISKASKEAISAIGLKLFSNSQATCMSVVYDEQADCIKKILKEKYKIAVAGGQEHLKGKLLRISHMGFIEFYEASWTINSIEMTLADMKRRKYASTATKVFNEICYSYYSDN